VSRDVGTAWGWKPGHLRDAWGPGVTFGLQPRCSSIFVKLSRTRWLNGGLQSALRGGIFKLTLLHTVLSVRKAKPKSHACSFAKDVLELGRTQLEHKLDSVSVQRYPSLAVGGLAHLSATSSGVGCSNLHLLVVGSISKLDIFLSGDMRSLTRQYYADLCQA